MPQQERVCPSEGAYIPVWEGISQYGRVCPSVGGCAPVWEGVSQCRRVCPSVGGCAPVWEGVPQCEREFSSVARNSLCNSPSSFSHTFFLLFNRLSKSAS